MLFFKIIMTSVRVWIYKMENLSPRSVPPVESDEVSSVFYIFDDDFDPSNVCLS